MIFAFFLFLAIKRAVLTRKICRKPKFEKENLKFMKVFSNKISIVNTLCSYYEEHFQFFLERNYLEDCLNNSDKQYLFIVLRIILTAGDHLRGMQRVTLGEKGLVP